jgi:hypothetical protein
MSLTGRFNFRKSLGGKIILQVEEETRPFWSFSSRGDVRTRWRDARSLDLALPALRGLVDLRDYIQETPQANSASVGGFLARRRREMEPQLQPPSAHGGGQSDRDEPRALPGSARR